MAARGYPDAPERGRVIEGLDQAAALPDVGVFHAGTVQRDGRLLADGGRVLTICGTGEMLGVARDNAYAALRLLRWPEGFYRTDIGRWADYE